jgi:uncharacterized protein YndB with AHSA1/START domain
VLQTILIVVGALIVVGVAAILLVAATKPNTFRIQREATIQAPPERVFALINDFHRWPSWSPWEKIDPNLTRTFTGAESGKGAVYEWEGNKKVGKGRMEITESVPRSRVLIKLDFIKPFESHNTTDFTLDRRDDGTHVTWAMVGSQPFMFKVMTVFMSMDKMVGKDFEAGLASLKAQTER